MALKPLSIKTVSLIKSSEVISSISSVVKELIENALDAGATTISVKFENFGLMKLEVKDNGFGILEEDLKFVCKSHCTSKICNFEDLNNISSYGFRGEALSSLCALSDLTIVTKTKDCNVGSISTFDTQGTIKDTKAVAAVTGTTVIVHNLFRHIPVRRQYFLLLKHQKEELKKIEELIMSYSIVIPQLHISLIHNKQMILMKSFGYDTSQVLKSMFHSLAKKLVLRSHEENELKLRLWLPKKQYVMDKKCSRSSSDRLFLFVNKRPVGHKTIEKFVKLYFSDGLEASHGRYPFGVLFIDLPSSDVDVNLEPNKDRILFRDEEIVLRAVRSLLEQIYGPLASHDMEATPASVNDFQDLPCTFASISPDHSQNDLCSNAYVSNTTNGTPEKSFVCENIPLADASDIRTRTKVTMHCESEGPYMNCNKSSISERGNGDISSFLVPKAISISETEQTVGSVETLTKDISHNLKTENPIIPGVLNAQPNSAVFGDNLNSVTGNTEHLTPRKNDLMDFVSDLNNLNKAEMSSDLNSPLMVGDPVIVVGSESWSRGQILQQNENIENVKLLEFPEKNLIPASKRNYSSEETDFLSKRVCTSGASANICTAGKRQNMLDVFDEDTKRQRLPGAEIGEKIKKFNAEMKVSCLKKSKENSSSRLQQRKKKPTMSLSTMLTKGNSHILDKFIAPSTPEMYFSRSLKSQDIRTSSGMSKPWQERVLVVENSVEKIGSKTLYPRKNDNLEHEECSRLIGCLKGTNGWLYRHGNCICGLNSSRMNEMIIYHSLMQSFSVPSPHLHVPFNIDEKSIGDCEWRVLSELGNSSELHELMVTDRRLTANGFRIVLFKESDCDLVKQGQIVGLVDSIGDYGIEELREILQLLADNRDLTLEESRPIKLRSWLKSEASRMTKVSPQFRDASVVRAKLQMWQKVTKDEDKLRATCLHGLLLFTPIASISSSDSAGGAST